MIITISGTPGSGKSSTAKLLAKKMGLKHYSTGDYMRKIADKKNVSLLEISKLAEKDTSIDLELDQWQISLRKDEDNFVIDSRLGFHFIKNSIKVFIDAELKKRAERILADKIRKEHNINLNGTIKKIRERQESEQKRYKKYYGLNANDKKNYDIFIDTTNLTVEETVDKLLDKIKRLNK